LTMPNIDCTLLRRHFDIDPARGGCARCPSTSLRYAQGERKKWDERVERNGGAPHR